MSEEGVGVDDGVGLPLEGLSDLGLFPDEELLPPPNALLTAFETLDAAAEIALAAFDAIPES